MTQLMACPHQQEPTSCPYCKIARLEKAYETACKSEQESTAELVKANLEIARLRTVLRDVTTRRPCFDTDCAHCLWVAEVVEATLSESVEKP